MQGQEEGELIISLGKCECDTSAKSPLRELLPVAWGNPVDRRKRGSGKEDIMTSGQIDRLCSDWLRVNCGEEVASKYRPYSLVITMWNTPELSEALETLRQVLCIAFGPDESFGTTDYHEVSAKLGLPDDGVPIPEVFIKAFAGTSRTLNP